MSTKHDTAVVKHDAEVMQRQETVATMLPLTDIYETEDAYVLMLDMPGATKESVSISIDKSRLTIRGTAELGQHEHVKVLHDEIRSGVYERTFNLTDSIDRNSVEAHYADGVLTIKLLKKEEVKARTIPVR